MGRGPSGGSDVLGRRFNQRSETWAFACGQMSRPTPRGFRFLYILHTA